MFTVASYVDSDKVQINNLHKLWGFRVCKMDLYDKETNPNVIWLHSTHLEPFQLLFARSTGCNEVCAVGAINIIKLMR